MTTDIQKSKCSLLQKNKVLLYCETFINAIVYGVFFWIIINWRRESNFVRQVIKVSVYELRDSSDSFSISDESLTNPIEKGISKGLKILSTFTAQNQFMIKKDNTSLMVLII